MRPTLLGFRAPDERTADFTTQAATTRDGKLLDITKETKHNPRGSNLPRAVRFTSMPFYDRATGQSVFTGPASYNAGLVAKKLTSEPCSATIVSFLSLIVRVETNQCFRRQRNWRAALHHGWGSNQIRTSPV
jgi:hypothetical protein